MNLDVVTSILEAAGVGRLGIDLFQDHMPDDVPVGCMVRLPVDSIAVSGYLPTYFRSGKVQAIVRAPSYEVGKALAGKVFKVLTIDQRTEFKGEEGELLMLIHHLRPTALPVSYARTPGNLTEWSVNFTGSYVMPL